MQHSSCSNGAASFRSRPLFVFFSCFLRVLSFAGFDLPVVFLTPRRLPSRVSLLCFAFALCLRSLDTLCVAGVVCCVGAWFCMFLTVRTDDHPVEVPGVPGGIQGDLRRTRPFGKPHEMVPHRRPRSGEVAPSFVITQTAPQLYGRIFRELPYGWVQGVSSMGWRKTISNSV